MPTPLLSVTTGWTQRLGPFTLRVDGIPLSLTGLTVTLVLRRADGTLVSPLGTVTPDPDQVTNPGQISYDPTEDDFVWVEGGATVQYARLHWQVVDGNDKVVSFPNGSADLIAVYQL